MRVWSCSWCRAVRGRVLHPQPGGGACLELGAGDADMCACVFVFVHVCLRVCLHVCLRVCLHVCV